MYSKRSHRRPDPLFLLMVFVVIGMCATVSYQILVFSDASQAKLARQGAAPIEVGG